MTSTIRPPASVITGTIVREWVKQFLNMRSGKPFSIDLCEKIAAKLEPIRKARSLGYFEFYGRKVPVAEWDAFSGDEPDEDHLNHKLRNAAAALQKALKNKISYLKELHCEIAETKSTVGEDGTPQSAEASELSSLLSALTMASDNWVKSRSKRWHSYATEIAIILTEASKPAGRKPSLQKVGIDTCLIQNALKQAYSVADVSEDAIAKYFYRKRRKRKARSLIDR